MAAWRLGGGVAGLLTTRRSTCSAGYVFPVDVDMAVCAMGFSEYISVNKGEGATALPLPPALAPPPPLLVVVVVVVAVAAAVVVLRPSRQ